MKRFDVEFVSAETGSELEYYDQSLSQVNQLVHAMKDGDDLVIHAKVTSQSVSL